MNPVLDGIFSNVIVFLLAILVMLILVKRYQICRRRLIEFRNQQDIIDSIINEIIGKTIQAQNEIISGYVGTVETNQGTPKILILHTKSYQFNTINHFSNFGIPFRRSPRERDHAEFQRHFWRCFVGCWGSIQGCWNRPDYSSGLSLNLGKV